MSGHGNHRHGAQAGQLLHLGSQRAHGGAGLHKASEVVGRQAHLLQYFGFEATRAGVHYLGRGGYRVFGHHLARQHVGQGVGHEENLGGGGKRRTAVAAQRVELEEAVEVHDLDAGELVDTGARHALEETFGRAGGVRVAVGEGLAQYLAVGAYHHKVDAPRVDAYRVDVDAALGHGAEALQYVVIEGKDVPIAMSANRYQIVGKAVDFLNLDAAGAHAAHYGASAGGAEVYCKKCLHCAKQVLDVSV